MVAPDRHVEKGFLKICDGVENLLKGMFVLLIGDVKGFYVRKTKSILTNWKEKKWAYFFSNLLSITIFTLIVVNSVVGICSWGYWTWHANWSNEIFADKNEVVDFFNKYNISFAAHDCAFMRRVGADEAMYDKYGVTTYSKDYSCEEFFNFQEKIYLPITIGEIKKIGNKYKVQGEMIVIEKNQDQVMQIVPLYFSLWKQEDWDLWHFDGAKSGPRYIHAELKN